MPEVTSPSLQWRKLVWKALHHNMGRGGHIANFMLLVFTVLSLSMLPLEYLPNTEPYRGLLGAVELITTLVFAIDYGLRVWSAPKRLRYIFSFYGITDLLSILPFVLGALGLEYVRLARLIRFFKLGDIEPAAMEEEDDVMRAYVGLADGEKLEYVVARHPIYLFVAIIPAMIATTVGLGLLLTEGPLEILGPIAGVLLLFAIVFLWKAWLDYSYDVLFITNRRLIQQEQHLLGRSINQVNFHAITNVKPYYPSLISYILGFGNIIVETPAAEIGQINMRTVRRHERAAHLIMHRCVDSHDHDSLENHMPGT